MFIQSKRSSKQAISELKTNLLYLGVWCAAIRAAPYVLQALQRSSKD